jgi:hypothetical protein
MESTTTTKRMPLRRSRRIPISVSLSVETHLLLARLGEGNRSAGIEELARMFQAHEISRLTESA